MYHHDNIPTAPFDNITLLLLSNEQHLTAAEKAFLVEFLTTVPKFSNISINEYLSKKEFPVPNEKPDINIYMKQFQESMPKVQIFTRDKALAHTVLSQ